MAGGVPVRLREKQSYYLLAKLLFGYVDSGSWVPEFSDTSCQRSGRCNSIYRQWHNDGSFFCGSHRRHKEPDYAWAASFFEIPVDLVIDRAGKYISCRIKQLCRRYCFFIMTAVYRKTFGIIKVSLRYQSEDSVNVSLLRWWFLQRNLECL